MAVMAVAVVEGNTEVRLPSQMLAQRAARVHFAQVTVTESIHDQQQDVAACSQRGSDPTGAAVRRASRCAPSAIAMEAIRLTMLPPA